MSANRTEGPFITPSPSQRGQVAPFLAMDLMRRANQSDAAGADIVHMEVGQPGTPAPAAARKAAARALENERLGYTDAVGLPALRAAIAGLYRDWHGVDVDPGRIVVTTGSSAGFVLAFLALFEAGDRVALTAPGYPCYRQILSAVDVAPVMLPVGPENRWMPTPDQVIRAAADGGLRGLLVASPANPTGTMLTPDRLEGLIGACREVGAWFISDEIYHGLTYDGPAQTALAQGDDVIVINSFSKYFSMTGWRIGWMVLPERLMRTVESLQQHLFISAPTLSQHAALGALEAKDELEGFRAVYARNRAVLADGLAAAGLERIAPADGAFYLYADVSHLTDDSAALARRLLDDARVAATPGADFDAEHGRKFIRFSYAGTPEAIDEGVSRLASFFASG